MSLNRKTSQKGRLERPVAAQLNYDRLRTLNRKRDGNQETKPEFHTSGKFVKSYKHKLDFKTRLSLLFSHDGSKISFIIIYYLFSIYIGMWKYTTYARSEKYATTRIIFREALSIARTSAGLLLFNCAIVLLPVCRTLISQARVSVLNSVIPFDKNIEFHKFVGVHIVIYTIVHIGAHVFDFLYLSNLGKANLGFEYLGSPELLWMSLLPAYTGHVATLSLFLIITSSLRKVRVANFEIFWFTHHLFIIFFVSLVLHGAGCVVETLVGYQCVAFTEFWKWCILSLFFYSAERLVFRVFRTFRPVKIQKIVVHPSNVVELQWVPRYLTQMYNAKPGQYIFLNCPEIGGMQFHPFTLTSCIEEGYMSVHIRETGDFTSRLSELLIQLSQENSVGNIEKVPKIYIDGPFGAAAEDAFKYKTCIFVGAGIGVTPFASLLKSVFFKVDMGHSPVRKLKLFWICNDTTAFEWFNDLLHSLEQQESMVQLEYHIYLSKVRDTMINKLILNDVGNNFDPITGLRSKTNYGRPNWDAIFAETAIQNPGETIGLFVCGPKLLTKALKKNCILYTNYKSTEAIFRFNKENFG
eukprot:NODE_8_length_47770_cov_0.334354.p5 type:complete len:581 gc:universal NODE_8_length_47770_cov_0.334354:2761-4503(+)